MKLNFSIEDSDLKSDPSNHSIRDALRGETGWIFPWSQEEDGYICLPIESKEDRSFCCDGLIDNLLRLHCLGVRGRLEARQGEMFTLFNLTDKGVEQYNASIVYADEPNCVLA